MFRKLTSSLSLYEDFCCEQTLPDPRTKQLFPFTEFFFFFSRFLSTSSLLPSLSHRIFLFKLPPLTLGCIAFECLLLLGTSSDYCHAYFIFLPSFCIAIASQRHDTFFAGMIVFCVPSSDICKRVSSFTQSS